MEKVLKLYITENDKADGTVYNQQDYEQSVIREMYIDTFEMYIGSNKRQETIRLLNTIKDKELRKLLCKKLLVA